MAEPVVERRISEKAFVGHYAAAGVAGLVLAAVLFMVPGWGFLAPLGILPVAAVWGYGRLMRASSCYRLYPDRLEVESGVLSRGIDNLELFRVRDVGLRQGFFGRMAGFGDVHVHSTDASTPTLLLRGIDSPKEFYQHLRQLVSESRAQNRTLIVEEGEPVIGG